MSHNISPQYEINDTVYFVQSDAIKQDTIKAINVQELDGGIIITYNLNNNLPVNETLLFPTAQDAANDFAERLVDDFES